jgi:hypothetical protein
MCTPRLSTSLQATPGEAKVRIPSENGPVAFTNVRARTVTLAPVTPSSTIAADSLPSAFSRAITFAWFAATPPATTKVLTSVIP